jgi:hypothetical protein
MTERADQGTDLGELGGLDRRAEHEPLNRGEARVAAPFHQGDQMTEEAHPVPHRGPCQVREQRTHVRIASGAFCVRHESEGSHQPQADVPEQKRGEMAILRCLGVAGAKVQASKGKRDHANQILVIEVLAAHNGTCERVLTSAS